MLIDERSETDAATDAAGTSGARARAEILTRCCVSPRPSHSASSLFFLSQVSASRHCPAVASPSFHHFRTIFTRAPPLLCKQRVHASSAKRYTKAKVLPPQSAHQFCEYARVVRLGQHSSSLHACSVKSCPAWLLLLTFVATSMTSSTATGASRRSAFGEPMFTP